MTPKSMFNFILSCVVLMLSACVAAPAAGTPATTSESDPPLADAQTRTITHALGETEITGTPERVVTLEWSYTEDVLALGVQPVGVADIEGYQSWVKIPIELSDNVVDVGTRQEPNLELLTELDPDLILAPAFRIAETYDQLSEIAPVLAFDAYPTDESTTQFAAMKETFLTIASVLGREAEGEAVLADLEAHFAAAQEQIDAAGLLDEPFVLAQAFGEDTVSVRLFTDNAMAVEIVEQIGLENSWEDAEFQLYGFTTVSVETLPELGPVHFFYVVQDDNRVFQRESIRPLWESLEFVQAGQAYPLGGDTWLFGGPLSARVLVDLIVETLTGEPVAQTDDTATEEAAAADQTCAAGFRLYTHPDIVGESLCVPEAPASVVTLEPFYSLQMAVKLGLPVVATAAYGDEASFPSALTEEETAGISFVGAFEQPNLETLTQLAPDLIIGDAYFHGERYDLLREIAPTVLINTADWKTWLSITGDVGGVSELATEQLAEYEARVADISSRLRDVEVSFVRVVPGSFQLYREAPDAYAPIAVMSDVGVVRPDFEIASGDNSWERLDWEGITSLTGDVLFYVAGGASDIDGAAQLEEEVTSNPIWQQLPAAQAGQAYRVDAEHWMSFGGLHSAHAVLDDIEEYLTE